MVKMASPGKRGGAETGNEQGRDDTSDGVMGTVGAAYAWRRGQWGGIAKDKRHACATVQFPTSFRTASRSAPSGL